MSIEGRIHEGVVVFSQPVPLPEGTRVRVEPSSGFWQNKSLDELALEQPIVSQQLAVLRHQGIVSTQKEGSSVRYALRDPLVGALLDVARRIFNNRLGDSQGLLRELRRESRRA